MLESALKLEPDHILSRWIRAESFRTEGKITKACKAYRWFAESYDQRRDLIMSYDDHTLLGAGNRTTRSISTAIIVAFIN